VYSPFAHNAINLAMVQHALACLVNRGAHKLGRRFMDNCARPHHRTCRIVYECMVYWCIRIIVPSPQRSLHFEKSVQSVTWQASGQYPLEHCGG
jgi:hypothetical protein